MCFLGLKIQAFASILAQAAFFDNFFAKKSTSLELSTVVRSLCIRLVAKSAWFLIFIKKMLKNLQYQKNALYLHSQ